MKLTQEQVTFIGKYINEDLLDKQVLIDYLEKCNLRSPTATGAVANGHSAVRQRPA